MQPFNATHSHCIQQARAIVGNPAAYADMPPNERRQLFGFAWAVLKSQHGHPPQQRRLHLIRPTNGGAA